MKNTTRLVAIAGAVTLTFAVAACGDAAPAPTPAAPAASPSSASSPSSAPTPSEALPTTSAEPDSPDAFDLVTKAKANAAAATSAEFSGEVETGGELLKVSYRGTSDAKTVELTVESSKQGQAHIIVVPEGSYIQGDRTFWTNLKAPASIANSGKKFIKTPAKVNSITDSISPKTFSEKAFGSISKSDLADEVGEKKINGVDCYVVTDRRGVEGGAIYISKDKNEMLRFTGTKTSPGSIDFGKWNEKLDIKAPPASQIKKLG